MTAPDEGSPRPQLSVPSLLLSEEQRLLQNSARDFIAAEAPLSALRALRDGGAELGYSESLWQAMVALGWPGVLLPESAGGSDFGHTSFGLLMEATGRSLVASPLLITAGLCAPLLCAAGSSSWERQLAAVVRGEMTMALALDEQPQHAPLHTALAAERSTNGGYTLSGRKLFVVDGRSASHLLVVAREVGEPGSAQGLTLFLIDAATAGIHRQSAVMIDSRDACDIDFDSVVVPPSAMVGEPMAGWELLAPALDRVCGLLAAEMLGSARAAFELTVAYMKERRQFGELIGSFQALQHRVAHLFAELELTHSGVYAALRALDMGATDCAERISAAKVRAADTFMEVAGEAIQLHGGIGMTDELDIGFYFKRAQAAAHTWGDSAFHRARYADILGV